MRNRNGKKETGRKILEKGTMLLTAGVLAGVLCSGSVFHSENMHMTVQAEETEEEDWLLIEDDGEVTVDRSGADLEELKAAEQVQTEPATEFLEDPEVVLEPASQERLQEHLNQLLQMESPTGSDGELTCAGYIEQVMESYGYTISEQSFHEGFLNENGVDAPGINIIAERGADSENRTSDIFIISTHYDSKTNPSQEDPFANDKSGAAALLEMARILSYVETDTDICFLFLSGEEDGLYGSSNFVKFVEENYAHRVAGVLHVELVGYAPEYAYLLKTADGEENYLGSLVKETGESLQLVQSQALEDRVQNGIESGAQNGKAQTAEAEMGMEAAESWIYIKDDKSSQYSFAQAGIDAVTVSQDVNGAAKNLAENREEDPENQIGNQIGASGVLEEEGEIPEEMQVIREESENTTDLEKLQEITDILAESIWYIMSEETGSLLPG